MKRTRTKRWAACAAIFCAVFSSAQAHTQTDAYLTISSAAPGVAGEWHIALRDLEDVVGLDANDDGEITWSELRARREAIWAYASSRLQISGDGVSGAVHLQNFLVENHSEGAYAVLRFDVENLRGAEKLVVNYQAFFDTNPRHRALFRFERNGQTLAGVFAPTTRIQQFELGKPASAARFLSFVREGVWHIWSGYDHVLFLLALLLPGVLLRTGGTWKPLAALTPAAINVLKIVTAFTVAHSLTLTLAALGFVQLPSRFVESAIAVSVVLAALNNLVPFFAERGWMVAFGFGLLHGFGFANALSDLGLHRGQMAVTLFGFNAGVELGQLAIVAVFLPLAFSVRHLMFYQRFVLQAGSAAIMLLATTWFAERLLNLKVLPF